MSRVDNLDGLYNFLLYSVILDTKSHHCFYRICHNAEFLLDYFLRLLLQTAVNSRRIVIILISAFSVRYLSSEYIEKENNIKDLPKSNRFWENFTAFFLNKENAEEKSMKCLKCLMNYRFNHAYLVNFGSIMKMQLLLIHLWMLPRKVGLSTWYENCGFRFLC